MTFTQWLRKAFVPRVQDSRASRRGKSRQPSRRRRAPRLEWLEDRLAPTIEPLTIADPSVWGVTGLKDSSHPSMSADGELIELCRRCLAPDRTQRPAHAGAVAEAVASYQARVRQRLQDAEVAQAAAQVKATEERKRRRVTGALQSSWQKTSFAATSFAARALENNVRRRETDRHIWGSWPIWAVSCAGESRPWNSQIRF